MLAEKKVNWRAYVYILIGTAVMAVSITSIYDHMQMVTGGFSGLAIIIKALTEKVMPGGDSPVADQCSFEYPAVLFRSEHKGVGIY